MNFEDLSGRQSDVTSAKGSTVLVLGGAGTGKTTAALWAARAAIERGEVAPHQKVLFLTFSRTAVSQITSRARGVLSGIRDSIEISTFHAFGLRMLQDFGRYAGLGPTVARIQSAARNKLLGSDAASISYDAIISEAVRIIGTAAVGALIARRWPLVICDEFQDTSPDQWLLLERLSNHSRLVLLADPNQMIYTFVAGVGPERLRVAYDQAQDVVTLQPTSFRDPSGCIPAMAEAIRERRFSAGEVRHAVAEGRLAVHAGITDDTTVEVLKSELRVAREAGYGSVGIFAHSNEGVAQLGASLIECGIEHSLVGIPEAQGEALAALSTLSRYGAGLIEVDEVGLALGTFLTACTRGQRSPPLAQGMAFGHPELPAAFDARLQSLKRSLIEAAQVGFGDLISAACDAWGQLGVVSGNRPWQLASLRFAASARRVLRFKDSLQETVQKLTEQAERDRTSVLVGDDFSDQHPVQIMNFYQTKGREADQVILLYRSGDYLANSQAAEPFTESSRVLYVALTRARKRVVVLLPDKPHQLIAPFAELA